MTERQSRLNGRVVLVTGGASGIGYAVAERVIADGGRAALADVDGQAAAAAAAKLGPDAQAIAMNVADEASVMAGFDAAVARFGRVDALVNNAGIARDIPLLDTTLDAFRTIIDINLVGAFLCGREAARRMIAQGGGGRIVNITSISGVRGNRGRTAYGASKAGLAMMTKVWAAELGGHGILVNAVAPGPVETPLLAQMADRSVLDEWEAILALHRFARPEEIAGPVAFLLSDDASFVTGHILGADGGYGGCGMLPRRD